MSELINNRVHRQQVLKELITDLHKGHSVEEVKERFAKLIEGVSVSEIADMEQALIREGMPVEEIQGLCDVHAAVFKGSIEEIHSPVLPVKDSEATANISEHPADTFRRENREIEKLISEQILPYIEALRMTDNELIWPKLKEGFALLWEIDKHYARKENILFPYMEQHDITAPPKVMWGVDDEIRGAIKETRNLLSKNPAEKDKDNVLDKVSQTVNRVNEMIFKEENILFPMILDTFSEEEWFKVAQASPEIGFAFITAPSLWRPTGAAADEAEFKTAEAPSYEGYVRFDAGFLLPEEINVMLNTLPIDITFVDKDNKVKYFTQGKERIFARPKTIIGRFVENCHPPDSVHVVEKIVADFRSGKKDHEDFWLRMGEQYVYIRYYALRNHQGEYLGTIEVSQDIQPIQEISGEKRLMSDG